MARHPLATWPMGIAGKYLFGKAVTNLATATSGTRTRAPRAADSLALGPRRPLLFPLRVAPLQQILGAGPAQMRAAVLHHHLAIDVAGLIGNQEAGEVGELAVFADDAGFDVFATTEHHFHSEGYEASVAPLLLYADLAARTKRIKFSPLGLVLPSWDPIRAAEKLAVLDQLTKGRIYAGFARGYQDRWVNVLGQQYHVTGAPMDGSAIDNHNRRVYEETLKVIRKAWTEETFDYNGDYYKVPFPYEEGIRRWPVAECR